MGEQWMSVSRGTRVETVEVSEDFSLPDYVPEVRRVLGVVRDVTADNGFRDGASYLQEGNVCCTVFYLGEDGQVASVPLSSAYSAKVPLPEDFAAEDGFVVVWDLENVSCRVTSPRRLSLSARIRLQSLAAGREDAACRRIGERPDAMVLRRETVPNVRLSSARHTASAEGSLREREGVTIAGASGNVCVQDVKAQPGGGLRVTGEVSVLLLARDTDGEPYPIRCRAAMEEVIPGRAGADGGTATACARPASLTVDCDPDGAITWRMEYDLHAVSAQSGESEVDVDGYSTVAAEEADMRAVTALLPGAVLCGRVTVSGEKAVSGDGAGCAFVYGFGRGQIDRVESSGGRLVCVGSVTVTVLLHGAEWVVEECTLPLRYETNGTLAPEGEPIPLLHVTVCDVGCRMDGENLRITAEAAIDGIVCAQSPRTLLSTLTAAAPLPAKKPHVTICVPAPGESAWDIQKSHRAGNVLEMSGRYVIAE